MKKHWKHDPCLQSGSPRGITATKCCQLNTTFQPCQTFQITMRMYVKVILDCSFYLGVTILIIMVSMGIFFTCKHCICYTCRRKYNTVWIYRCWKCVECFARWSALQFPGISSQPDFVAAIKMSFISSTSGLVGVISSVEGEDILADEDDNILATEQVAPDCSTCLMIKGGDYMISGGQCPVCWAKV